MLLSRVVSFNAWDPNKENIHDRLNKCQIVLEAVTIRLIDSLD